MIALQNDRASVCTARKEGERSAGFAVNWTWTHGVHIVVEWTGVCHQSGLLSGMERIYCGQLVLYRTLDLFCCFCFERHISGFRFIWRIVDQIKIYNFVEHHKPVKWKNFPENYALMWPMRRNTHSSIKKCLLSFRQCTMNIQRNLNGSRRVVNKVKVSRNDPS